MKKNRNFHHRLALCASLLLTLSIAPLYSQAADTTPAEQLKAYNSQAGRAGDARQGELFFTQKHGGKDIRRYTIAFGHKDKIATHNIVSGYAAQVFTTLDQCPGA